MRSAVLDSFAVLAFLFREKGHAKVTEILERAAESDQLLLMAAPHWAEVRYQVERKFGRAQWSDIRTKLFGLPIQVVSVDRELAEIAGEIKASRKMSLADCFAAALARQGKAEIYTGDPEFRAVEKEIRVVWL